MTARTTTSNVWYSQVILLCAIILGACETPQDRIDADAARFGFDKQRVHGSEFDHVVYRSWRSDQQVSQLHIYLEGDGSPWRTRTRVSSDPTPKNPIALALMARDPTPALYLGRPCYNGFAGSPGCTAALWTNGRYGPKIVTSMASALSKLIAPIPKVSLILIGHSGGGTLAVLLAERFPQTRAVITIAGNLNVSRWAELHHYTPLLGSFDPAQRQPLPPRITQIHYLGGRDQVVPPQITRSFVNKQAANTVLIEIDDFDHHCCWASVWPTLLGRSQTIMNRAPAR